MKSLILAIALLTCVPLPASAQIILQQTDAEANGWTPGTSGCTTSNADPLVHRVATASGIPGLAANPITTGALTYAEAAILFASQPGEPNSASWEGGLATFRLEVTTANMRVTWAAISYGYLRASDDTHHILNCFAGAVASLSTTGVKSAAALVSAAPFVDASDSIWVLYGFANGSRQAASWAFRPSQQIDLPVIQR